MKILVVSDTHRKHDNYLKVLEMEKPLDMVIHCGDAEGSEYLIEETAACPLLIVLGNNDFFSSLPREIETVIGGKKVMITHGHGYGVSMGNGQLKDEARSRHMDIVFYGHTHRPVVETEGGLTAVNPGSLSYPRQDGKRPSYVVMEGEEKTGYTYRICYL